MNPEFELLEALFAADADRAAAVFAGEPSLDCPHAGSVSSRAQLDAVAEAWPAAFGLEPGAEVELRVRHVADGRAVSEARVGVNGPNGSVTLPIAIIGDLAGDDRISEARVYYAERWVTGSTEIRRSSWPQTDDERYVTPEELNDVNAEYLRAVVDSDIEGIMQAFGSDPYVEFGPLRLYGRDDVRALYEHFFARGAEIRFIFPTITDDGESCVVEWTGGPVGKRNGGITAYNRDATGRLGSIHMYDNFDVTEIPGVAPVSR
jgi:hypothetical protein